MIEIIKTEIEGLLIIKPKLFLDNRGSFYESYNKKSLKERGIDIDFVQDNQSISHKGVLRGIHFQKLQPQTKLVRVIKGKIYDVAVDLRKGSKTFGKYFGIILSGNNYKQLLIPKGFGHGFYVMSSEAIVSYKVDTHYIPNDEGGITWNDIDLNIPWPINLKDPILSDKDRQYTSLKEQINLNK